MKQILNKNNLERLQKMQEKKANEIAIMENERKRAEEERERLKRIVSQIFVIKAFFSYQEF